MFSPFRKVAGAPMDQPVLINPPGQSDPLFVMTFSSIEKLEAWMKVINVTDYKIKQVDDPGDFIESVVTDNGLRVMHDPYIHNGNTRWTELMLLMLPSHQMNQDQMELKMLRTAALKAASSLTSCDPELYEDRKSLGLQKSPLEGHCAAMACMIQGIFGGDIVTGRVDGTSHYWNRLPDGQEVDLTSCQFGGDGFTPFKRGRKVKRGETINPRFILFAQLVKEKLGEDNA